MDGHAMAKQGQAARALSLAFLSSMAGGLLGALGLTFSIPVARPLVLAFGAPELFMLTLLGISLTALLSRGNMLKGLVAGVLGVLLGSVGAAPSTAEYRYSFGSLFLSDGLDLVAVALGVYGLAEIALLVGSKSSIAERITVGGGWAQGARDFLRYWRLVLRGALVGIWAGVLPGIGATAGTWMAYGQTVATAKDREKFGKGDPRGIVAPESANNSVEAGDLIPTLLFGIPGGAPAALLLGALLLYGIEPGPRLVTDQLDLVYTIVWSFALASVLGAALCAALSVPLSGITRIRFTVIAPLLIVVMLMSAYQSSEQTGDLIVMVVLGLAGVALRQAGYPRAPLLIGFVLSAPLERYYFLTANLYNTGEWIVRPGVIVMALLLVAPLASAAYRRLTGRSAPSVGEGIPTSTSTPTPTPVPAAATPTSTPAPAADVAAPAAPTPAPAAGITAAPADEDAATERTLWSPAVTAVALVLFTVALVVAQGFGKEARLLPNLACGAGIALSLLLLVRELPAFRRRGDGEAAAWAPAWPPEIRATLGAFAWLVLFLVLLYLLGFVGAAAVFLPLFLWRAARLRARLTALYTVIVVLLLLVLHATSVVDLPTGLLIPVLPVIV
jgi:putative tricarboxylic transport membrane protein